MVRKATSSAMSACDSEPPCGCPFGSWPFTLANMTSRHHSPKVLPPLCAACRWFTECTWPAWAGAISVLVVAMVWSFGGQPMRRNLSEDGRRLKGPRMITVKEFNRWSRADGIGFSTTTRGEMVCIPRSFESSHMMIMGDSGTGKSALQRQLLMQIMERRETAIVYDPTLEYTPQFYRPERGHLILNPLDVRCPYWSASDEVVHEEEALTQATALFPEKPRETTFFVDGRRKTGSLRKPLRGGKLYAHNRLSFAGAHAICS